MVKREFSIFLVVGLLTVLIDYVTYRMLSSVGGFDVTLTKGGGFLVGTVFSYFANRVWTFGHRDHASGSAWRFGVLYGATLGANVLINSLLLQVLSGRRLAWEVAFLGATGVSAALNFIGMKFFVFEAKGQGVCE